MGCGIRKYLDQVLGTLKANWYEIPPELEDEFKRDLLQTNLYRIKIIAGILLIASIPLIYLDFLNYEDGLWIIVPGYRFLFYAHVLLVCVLLIPLMITRLINLLSEYRASQLQRVFIFCFFLFILLAVTLISIVDQTIHGEITAYIMGTLGLAVIVYLNPVTSLFAYLISFALFLYGISHTQMNFNILRGHYINSSLSVLISWTFSVTLFKSRLSDFINRKRLEYLADFDYLTGCLNRRAFINRLKQEIERARREYTTISILLIDIDFFKQVNDRYGHLAGDFVLKQLLISLNNSCRNYDIMGRFGGEEFIICLPDTDLNAATEIAERLRHNIEKNKMMFDSNIINVTVSLGVAALEPTSKENIDKFISRADTAMYQAKTKRNHVYVSY